MTQQLFSVCYFHAGWLVARSIEALKKFLTLYDFFGFCDPLGIGSYELGELWVKGDSTVLPTILYIVTVLI